VEKFHAVNILWDEVTPVKCGKASMEPRNILLPQFLIEQVYYYLLIYYFSFPTKIYLELEKKTNLICFNCILCPHFIVSLNIKCLCNF
jgi:hypothetical protein